MELVAAAVAANLYDNNPSSTNPAIVSKSEEDANSNLNVVDVDIEYWKEERISQTTVTNNPIHEKCIHSMNIANNGETLSLPLFSLVYQVEQLDEDEEVISNPNVVPSDNVEIAPVVTSTNLTNNNLKLIINNSKEEGKEPEDVNSNCNCGGAAADDDIDSVKLPLEYENSIGDLAGIHQEYLPGEYNNLDEYVNAYNSMTDKTKLIILETHRVNKNDVDSLNTDIQCSSFIIEDE